MANIELSLEQRYNKAISGIYNIAYESNVCRVGWELHKIETDVLVITNPKDIQPNEYYLGRIYLNDLWNDLIEISETLPQWVDTYLTGRTSLYNIINLYTSENLEKHIIDAETKLKEAKQLKKQFIKRQKI